MYTPLSNQLILADVSLSPKSWVRQSNGDDVPYFFNEVTRPVITTSTMCRNLVTNNNFNYLQAEDKKTRWSSERQV